MAAGPQVSWEIGEPPQHRPQAWHPPVASWVDASPSMLASEGAKVRRWESSPEQTAGGTAEEEEQQQQEGQQQSSGKRQEVRANGRLPLDEQSWRARFETWWAGAPAYGRGSTRQSRQRASRASSGAVDQFVLLAMLIVLPMVFLFYHTIIGWDAGSADVLARNVARSKRGSRFVPAWLAPYVTRVAAAAGPAVTKLAGLLHRAWQLVT